MYNVNYLVAALQNGKTADQISKEMTDALNAAKAEVERQEAEKANAKLAEKRQAAADVFSALGNYLAKVHPDSILTKKMKGMTLTDKELDDIIQQLDELVQLASALGDLAEALGIEGETIKIAPKTKTIPTKVKMTSSNDPLEEFLNAFVRK